MTSTMTERARQMVQPGRAGAEQREAGPKADVNVGIAERWVSALGGSTLALLGLGMLMSRRRSVIGGITMAASGATLAWRGISGHCSAYEALGVRSDDATATSHPLSRHVHVRAAVTVNKPADELYRYWRDLSQLPRVMRHLESVEVLDDQRSRWRARAPRDRTVEWDAIITEDRPNEVIAWRSVDRSEIDNEGRVLFRDAPGDRGTEVHVDLQYRPPAGAIGAAVAKLFGEEPQQQIDDDLRRFKQIMETGQTPTTEGQPRGTCG